MYALNCASANVVSARGSTSGLTSTTSSHRLDAKPQSASSWGGRFLLGGTGLGPFRSRSGRWRRVRPGWCAGFVVPAFKTYREIRPTAGRAVDTTGS